MFKRNPYSVGLNGIFFIGSILLLIYPALINGYPLLYSDSGAYIASGFDNHVPVDRPFMYSFFVRHVSLSHSLWFVVCAQAILITSLFLIIIKQFTGPRNYFVYTFISIALLGFSTGLSNYSSQIMADIFSATAILGLCCLLLFQHVTRSSKLFLAILVIFSGMAHSSNLLVITVLIVFLFPFRRIFQLHKIALKTRMMVVVIIAVTWLLIPSLNSVLGAGFKVSRAPNIFIMGRLLESGVVKDYLAESCKDNPNELCKYDHLPEYSGDFLWEPNSPLYDGGCNDRMGSDCWLVKNEKYAPVVTGIFTTPKYLMRFIGFSLKETGKQLVSFKVEDLEPQAENSPVIDNIGWHYKSDYKQYLSAEQAEQTLTFNKTSFIQYIMVIVSTVFLILVISIKKWRERFPNSFLPFVLICFLAIVINAGICASLSMVSDRFQARIIWIIPFLALIGFYSVFFKKK